MSVSVIVYKVAKLDDQDIRLLANKHVDDIETLCPQETWEYKAYLKEEVDKTPDRFADIMKFMKPIELRRTIVDHKQCYIDNGLPAEAKYYSVSYRPWGFVISFDGKNISIPRETLDHYSREEVNTFYVYKREYIDADVSDWVARTMMDNLEQASKLDLSYHPYPLDKNVATSISKCLSQEYDDGDLYASEEILAFMMLLLKVFIGECKKVFMEFQD